MPPKPLLSCLWISVGLWAFAVAESVMAVIGSGRSAGVAATQAEHWLALDAAILFAAWTIGSVINEKL